MLFGIVLRDIGQRAAPVVGRDDENLDKHDGDQDGCGGEFAELGIDGNGENAAGEEGPGEGVDELY